MSTMKIIKRGMKPKYDVSPRSDAPFISDAEIAAMLDELRKDPEATIQRYTEYLGEPSKTLPEKIRADISEMQRGDIEYLRETLAIEDPDERAYHFEMQATLARDEVIDCFAEEFKSRQAYVWAWREAQAADRALAEAHARWLRAKIKFDEVCADKP